MAALAEDVQTGAAEDRLEEKQPQSTRWQHGNSLPLGPEPNPCPPTQLHTGGAEYETFIARRNDKNKHWINLAYLWKKSYNKRSQESRALRGTAFLKRVVFL